MNCSLSGSSTQEILPARISEWVAIAFSAVKRNAFESVLMRWMNLEPITQSEVSQKEKDKYRRLMPIRGIQKEGIEEFSYRAAMEKQT